MRRQVGMFLSYFCFVLWNPYFGIRRTIPGTGIRFQLPHRTSQAEGPAATHRSAVSRRRGNPKRATIIHNQIEKEIHTRIHVHIILHNSRVFMYQVRRSETLCSDVSSEDGGLFLKTHNSTAPVPETTTRNPHMRSRCSTSFARATEKSPSMNKDHIPGPVTKARNGPLVLLIP